MGARVLLAAAGAFLAFAAPASAGTAFVATKSTISKDPNCGPKGPCGPPFDVLAFVSTVRLTAGPGESNNVSAELAGDFGPVTFRDAGAPLVAGSGCEQLDPNSVRCDPAGSGPPPSPRPGTAVRSVNVTLADGDDRFLVAGAPPPGGTFQGLGTSTSLTVLGGDGRDDLRAFGGAGGAAEGGPGNDVILASDAKGDAGDDTLTGGTGLDQLDGGQGADVLTGGGSADSLVPGSGEDRVDGGGGSDSVSYEGLAQPASIDLRGRQARRPGFDADVVTSVEGARGSSRGDRIVGTGGANLIESGEGPDTVYALGGADAVESGRGADRVSAGAGRDDVRGDTGNDRISGGSGNDELTGDEGTDRIAGDSGRDALEGSGGRDRLLGGSGGDTIAGGGRPRISCGRGRDTVSEPGRRVVLPADCERVDPFGFSDSVAVPRLTATGAALTVPNLCQVDGEPCLVRVTLSRGRRKLGSGRVRVVKNRPRRLRIGLPQASRRLARSRAVRVTVRTVDSDNDSASGSFQVRLG